MDQACFNSYKIDLYCKLGDYAEEYLNKLKYSIKDCRHMLDNIKLASAMIATICPLCLNDEDENYCLTEEELCQIVTYIRGLLRNCNC